MKPPPETGWLAGTAPVRTTIQTVRLSDKVSPRGGGAGHDIHICGHLCLVPEQVRLELRYDTIRYDTRCYFNVRSKADMSQLNLPHGTDN